MSTPIWRLVAEREVSTRIRDKSFLVGVAITLAIVIGVLVVSAFVGSSASKFEVATGPDIPAALVDSVESTLQASNDSAEVEATEESDRAAVEAAVRDGADAGLISTDDGYVIIGDDGIGGELEAALRGGISGFVVAQNAEEAGTDITALTAGSTPTIELLDPNAGQSDARSGIAFGFAIVFLMTGFTFGMSIAQSVVQEKESRIVEILAAAVPIRALLWGKVLGNTVLALGQVLLLVGVGVAGLALTGETELLSGVGPAMAAYVAFFILGFIALASLWAVAGSLAARNEDLQSTTLPGQMILLVPYFVALTAGEEIRTVFSMLPIVSAMIMPGRMAEGSVPFWQIAVAIAVTIAAAVIFVRAGSKLYERTVLKTGSKISYREALTTSSD